MRDEARLWMEQAEADMKTARDNLHSGNLYLVALFCQQAVEKGLKAIHVAHNRKEAPRTHNLARLSREIRVPTTYRKTITLLNPNYLLTRYPDIVNDVPANMFDRESATEMLAQTEELFEWIRTQLDT